MNQPHPTTDEDPTLELLISIGGLVGHVVLESPPVGFAREVAHRFAAFCLPNADHVERAFSVRVHCRDQIVRDASGAPLPLSVSSLTDQVTVARADFAATLTRTAGKGPLVGTGASRPAAFALESLLRVLWSVFLPREGGALFHACGLHVDGRGLLAPGPSGAGKTTLARKAAEEDILSDEVVAVARGLDGRWRLSATPFFGELQHGGHSMRSYPLAGIAFLEKRATLAIEPLGLPAAVKRALECLLCFETDAATAERNFAIVVALCQEVPSFVCASRSDTPLPDLVRAMNPHLVVPPSPAAAPESTRELVSALRANLRRHGHYAFQPRGGSMRPFVRCGDAIFVEAVTEDEVRTGDVVLYWRVGRTAARDTLICHRVIGRLPHTEGSLFVAKGDSLPHLETFENGTTAALLGRVRAVSSRAGHARPLPGRIGSVGIVVASLLSPVLPLLPILRLLGRR